MSTTNSLPATDSSKLAAYKQQALKDYKQASSILSQKSTQATEDYLKPAVHAVGQVAQERPILSSVIAVFLAYSILPILTFSVFALGTIAVIGGSALAFTLFWCGLLIGGAALALAGTLFFTGFLTIVTIVWGLGSYLAFRLAINVVYGADLPSGLQAFSNETKSLLGQSITATKQTKEEIME